MTGDDEINLLQKLVKQRRESADIFKTQKRNDLASLEEAQLKIIQEFLPKQLDDLDLEKIIKDIILEVKAKDVKIGSIGGGGRYDDLTSIFGLQDISGVGISFGIDRIYLVMEELDLFPSAIDVSTTVIFANFGEQEAAFCLPLLKQLRANRIRAELYPTAAKMKKQMTYANNKGVQFVIMVGEDEMNSGAITLKNMVNGTQEKLKVAELIKKLS